MKTKHLLILTLFVSFFGFAQDQTLRTYQIRTVAFYNLENLFDTIDNPTIRDEQSPIMELKANKSDVYFDKIDKLGKVISQIGRSKNPNAPEIIGLAEIENDTVLKDLIHSEFLKDKGYDFVHVNSPDRRGIDVALLYQPQYFKPDSFKNYPFYLNNEEGNRIYTRDQLLVSGYLDNEMIHIIVNHWPSRRGGSKSIPYRKKAGALNRKIIDEILLTNPKAKIITLGDFNDDPTSPSIKRVLKTKKSPKKLKPENLYNPYESLYNAGFNTLAHRDQIHLFDQIILSGTLIDTDKNYQTYSLFTTHIFKPKYLVQTEGRYKGYPKRSFANGYYTGGYSDHYPVYVYLVRKY